MSLLETFDTKIRQTFYQPLVNFLEPYIGQNELSLRFLLTTTIMISGNQFYEFYKSQTVLDGFLSLLVSFIYWNMYNQRSRKTSKEVQILSKYFFLNILIRYTGLLFVIRDSIRFIFFMFNNSDEIAISSIIMDTAFFCWMSSLHIDACDLPPPREKRTSMVFA